MNKLEAKEKHFLKKLQYYTRLNAICNFKVYFELLRDYSRRTITTKNNFNRYSGTRKKKRENISREKRMFCVVVDSNASR